MFLYFHPTLISRIGLIIGGRVDTRWDNFLSRRLKWVALLAAFCLLEQLHIGGPRMTRKLMREEVAGIADQVDSNCLAFALVPTGPAKGIFELAAWTALATGKPSINARILSYRRLEGLHLRMYWISGDQGTILKPRIFS